MIFHSDVNPFSVTDREVGRYEPIKLGLLQSDCSCKWLILPIGINSMLELPLKVRLDSNSTGLSPFNSKLARYPFLKTPFSFKPGTTVNSVLFTFNLTFSSIPRKSVMLNEK